MYVHTQYTVPLPRRMRRPGETTTSSHQVGPQPCVQHVGPQEYHMCLKVSTMSRYHTSDGPLGRLHPANSLSPIKAVCPSSHTSTAEPRGIRIITPNANHWPKLTLSMKYACDPTRLSRIAELHSYFANMLLGHRQTFEMLNNAIAF